jgi:hypothetical protein
MKHCCFGVGSLILLLPSFSHAFYLSSLGCQWHLHRFVLHQPIVEAFW